LLADNRPRLEDLSMPSFAVAAVSVRNAVKRLRRNRRGSVAVEFAFIAPIFFALLFAIIETGMVFFAGQVLETGTQDSARLMFTHQAQDGGMSEFDFKTDLCNRIKTLFNCAGDPMSLNVDVTLFAPGTSISLTDPIVGGKLTPPFTYRLPPVGTVSTVVVRVFYPWQLFVTGLGYNIANLEDHQRLLAATAAFHVEP